MYNKLVWCYNELNEKEMIKNLIKIKIFKLMFFYEFILFIGTITLSLISISGFGALIVNSKKANSLELIFFGFH